MVFTLIILCMPKLFGIKLMKIAGESSSNKRAREIVKKIDRERAKIRKSMCFAHF